MSTPRLITPATHPDPLPEYRKSGQRRRAGMGLPEMLIALAISAALLTAVIVAISASLQAYSVNTEQSDLMQRARLAMYRMTAAIRAGQQQAPSDATLAGQFAAGGTVSGSGLNMLDESGIAVSFTYDSAKKQVIATSAGTPHVLLQGVESFQISMEPMRSATAIKTGGAWDLLRRATILASIRTTSKTATAGEGLGQQVVTLSASVMPRKNTW